MPVPNVSSAPGMYTQYPSANDQPDSAGSSGPRKTQMGREDAHQPKLNPVNLRDRILYPIKVNARRMIDAVKIGKLIGGSITGIPSAVVGAGVGAVVGGVLGGVKLLADRYRGVESYAVFHGVTLGIKTGGLVVCVLGSIPGVVVGALALAVCGVVRGVLCLPFDIYRACSSDCLTIETTKLNMSTLAEPLRLLGLERFIHNNAQDLTEKDLNQAYRKKARDYHPDRRDGYDDGKLDEVTKARARVKEAIAKRRGEWRR
ncbi:hypothetical protein [Endozoicomonas sp.]|uniref:hypothetical protein n=1 Tax=Endozoicomonas sp. TaxID=1892382 RepID=UPI002886B449|nr:J domain-containing protein [Endozoicomonas sp.]